MKSKIFNILLSIVVACGLWIYVITVERTEVEYTYYNVPVILDGESVLEERGLRIPADTEPTVTLKLNGNRATLNKLRSSDITVLVDLTRIYEAGTKELSYTVSFPGDVQNGSIEVVSRDPAAITLEVAHWSSKEIPVEVSLTGSPATGFIIDRPNVSVDHETVTVEGPKDVVDKLAVAKVVVDMAGRSESVDERIMITLCDAEGQPMDVSSITPDPYRILVKVPVLMVKDVKLDIPVIDGGGLTKDDVTVTIDGVDISREDFMITVSGPASEVEKLGDTISLPALDLSKETMTFIDREYEVALPDGIRNSSGVETVKVSLTLPQTNIAEFRVSREQFEVIAPTGLEYEIGAKILKVRVQGRQTVLDKVTVEDIRVVLDLTGATQTDQYPVTVTVEGVEGVGVVSDPSTPLNEGYQVLVIIKEPDGGTGG